MNGKNGLACITPLSETVKNDRLVIRPLPGLPVVRDLVVDMTMFYQQYEKVKPYLINDQPPPAIERLQSPEDREKLDGLYECILCACCSTACPSFWWNPDRFIGPSGLLQAYRFLIDSRDTATNERLAELDDPYSVFRCHGIQNCVVGVSEEPQSDQGHRSHPQHAARARHLSCVRSGFSPTRVRQSRTRRLPQAPVGMNADLHRQGFGKAEPAASPQAPVGMNADLYRHLRPGQQADIDHANGARGAVSFWHSG